MAVGPRYLSARPNVRHATAEDRTSLAAFSCRSSERKDQLETERLIQEDLLDHVSARPERRLLLLETESEGLVAVASHEPGTVEQGPKSLDGTYLLVIAIARNHQGAAIPASEMPDDQDCRVSSFLMSEAIRDVVSQARGPFIHGLVHKRNAASWKVLKRAGLVIELPARDAYGQLIPGYSILVGRLPAEPRVR